MTKKEKMIDMKCAVCGRDMQIRSSLAEKCEERGIDVRHALRTCPNCISKIGDALRNKKIDGFIEEIGEQMNELGEKDEIAGKIAEEITNENIDILFDELEEMDASEKDKIKESFYRGTWAALFLIGNNHPLGFLEKEAEHIRDFHEKTKKREKQQIFKNKFSRK